MSKALRAPLTMNDIPMRLATWTYKEPGRPRVRLLITAEVERNASQPLDYTAGFILVDRNNRVTASNVDKRRSSASDSDPGDRGVFAGALPIDPGRYLLRFAAADSEGRLGSVERKLDALQMDGPGLASAICWCRRRLGRSRRPPGAVDRAASRQRPSGGDGRGLCAPRRRCSKGCRRRSTSLPTRTPSRLTSAPMQIASGPLRGNRIGVQALVSTAALPPGRYLARATHRRRAASRSGHFVRPFRVVAGATATAAAVPGARTPTALPPSWRRRF